MLILTLAVMAVAGLADDPIPRPEHPRPDRQRETWVNLNGTWDFAETDDSADESFLAKAQWPDKIVVPFCRESKLSGLERKGFVRNVWYRRTIPVPGDWTGKRILLHIGACDWRTTGWLDGVRLGEHTGGNVPITWELKDARPGATHTLVIRAFDDTRSGVQQLGKQSDRPESYGIMYTRTTGIWQTVWLEAVGTSYVRDLFITSDPATGRVTFRSEIDGARPDLKLRISVSAPETYGFASTVVEQPMDGLCNEHTLTIPKPHVWSVEEPFLYDAELTLYDKQGQFDRVHTYFGLRTIDVRGRQFLINGKPVFQRLVLDQGFYPDGIWTAPSDEGLKRDIELSKAAGFNGARLHQKIFEPRFHYWADKLGYLTWGETPSFGARYDRPEVALPVIHEAVAFVRRDRNHPSIIGWCPFNETDASAGPLQNVVYDMIKAMDPTRPVIETSGYVKSHPDADVDCRHDYAQDPAALAANWGNIGDAPNFPPQYNIARIDRPFFLSEFGGIGWVPEGKKGWGYGTNPKTLDEWYARYEGQIKALCDNRFMFGFCYTQLTDVEQECNGIYDYDRTPKFDMARVRSLTTQPAEYEHRPPVDETSSAMNWITLVKAAVDAGDPAVWQFTTSAPPEGDFDRRFDWRRLIFKSDTWSTGQPGFGKKEGWESRIKTPWTTPDIWLRTEFEYDGAPFDAAYLIMHYDNATEVYLNGEPLLELKGWNDAYAPFDVTPQVSPLPAASLPAGRGARPKLLKGRNVLAVHTHQDTGGQYIDCALLLGRSRLP